MKLDSREFDDLEARVKKFMRYERIWKFMNSYWVGVWMSLVLVLLVINASIGREVQAWETWTCLIVITAVVSALIYVPVRRMKKHRLEDDEWAMYYTSSLSGNLQKFFKTKNPEWKKDYRRKAIKKAKEFLSCVENRWKIGNFKLAKDRFKKPILEFKKNIRYRLIPTLKEGDDELLRQAQNAIDYYHLVTAFSLESINKLNEQMSSRLPSRERMRTGRHHRLIDFLRIHKITRHALFTLSLIIGCCAFYYMAVGHLGVSKDYAFGGSVAIFVGLLTVYFAKQPKE